MLEQHADGSDGQKVCFVIMGFNKKTDFETGRTLDLDATYEAIIKPAVTAEGFRCVRADEVMHSGVIDLTMYEMLLRADLVIADLSTSNANALYELGVRHALRPYATILMKESRGRLHFDLNHISTLKYEHLGEDIGAREAKRAEAELREKIRVVAGSNETDSPVYIFLRGLLAPSMPNHGSKRTVQTEKAATERLIDQMKVMSDRDYREALDKVEASEEQLLELTRRADQATSHEDAVEALTRALELMPGDPYLVQQLALHTYKRGKPSKVAALRRGLKILKVLDPENSNDPETLGIAGAIYKRLWGETGSRDDLDAAIAHYGRGFEVRRDYYNGENLATCLEMRSSVQVSADEAFYDQMRARKTRESVAAALEALVRTKSFKQRSDRKWVFATLANMAFALGDAKRGIAHERAFLLQKPKAYEVETYEAGKTHALAVADRASTARR